MVIQMVIQYRSATSCNLLNRSTLALECWAWAQFYFRYSEPLRVAIIFGLRLPIDKHLNVVVPKLHAQGERFGVRSFVDSLKTDCEHV